MMSGGYDIGSATLYGKAGKLRASEKEMLGCQRCGKLLRDAIQLITCGCRYCKSCIKTIIGEMKTSEAQMKCPKDGEVFVKSDVCIHRS
jgi:late competence protein required for DNA uptake (superfamily II DNA/RNA helicase)